jgi:uncharacterized protein (TIGR03067 family)
MNLWTACTALGALLFVGGTDITEAIKKDKAALQGTWKVTESVNRGEKATLEEIKDLVIIFRGDSIFIREGKETAEKLTYLLEPTKKPKEIDLTFKDGPNRGRQDRAIYVLEKETLRICIQGNKDVPRPRDFISPPNSDLWLVVLQRTKE